MLERNWRDDTAELPSANTISCKCEEERDTEGEGDVWFLITFVWASVRRGRGR